MESLPDLNCNHLLLRFKVCKFEKFLHKLYLWRVIEDRFRVWWFLVNILSTGSLISTPQKNSPRTSIWISMEDILSVILIYFRLSEKVYDTKLQILGNSRLPNFFSLRKKFIFPEKGLVLIGQILWLLCSGVHCAIFMRNMMPYAGPENKII